MSVPRPRCTAITTPRFVNSYTYALSFSPNLLRLPKAPISAHLVLAEALKHLSTLMIKGTRHMTRIAREIRSSRPLSAWPPRRQGMRWDGVAPGAARANSALSFAGTGSTEHGKTRPVTCELRDSCRS